MTVPMMPVPRGGLGDVISVLCLMQAGFLLLGGLGETLLMGSAGYLAVPVAKTVLLLVIAAKVVSGRRWALIAMIVVESVTLFGFWLQVAAGALPWIDFTVNLVVLITNVAMPAAVGYQCVALLMRRRAAYPLAAPQDPYAPAPLVTTARAPQLVLPTAAGWMDGR